MPAADASAGSAATIWQQQLAAQMQQSAAMMTAMLELVRSTVHGNGASRVAAEQVVDKVAINVR
jgi:hypothetical protein